MNFQNGTPNNRLNMDPELTSVNPTKAANIGFKREN